MDLEGKKEIEKKLPKETEENKKNERDVRGSVKRRWEERRRRK